MIFYMRIIVDAFGGDHAPLEILRGCALAVRETGVEILLTGREDEIQKCAADNQIDLTGMQILHAPDIMLMTDHAADILKSRSNTSMAVGLKALAAGQGDAFVSAGSTAALVMGATFIVKRIRGIKRAAIAAVMPANTGPVMLIDMGANADCTAEYLHQFAVMGDIYMQKVMGFDAPRIGLANIGTEEGKGGKLQIEAFDLMKQGPYNFIGNIEARDIPHGCCEVVVADGFTGNIILKMYEGVAGAIMTNLKAIYKKNPLTMLSALMVKGGLTEFKKKMDYTEFGGAPLLGINGVVIKAHGSSDAKAIKNAVRQAKIITEQEVVMAITDNITPDPSSQQNE